MKLNIEIKDNKILIYSYEIGENKHEGSTPLCVDALIAFTSVVQLLCGSYKWNEKEWERKVIEREYIERLKQKPPTKEELGE